MSAKGFASATDTAEKKISFDEIGRDLYAFTAEGDPNSGVIVGDDSVMVVDAQATPVMALEVIERVRKVTDKPINYVLLTHYHAVRVLGASAYQDAEILASDATRGMIVERGQQDKDSEIGRFPRLFRAVESIPGLTWPTITFPDQMSIWLGKREVRIMHHRPRPYRGRCGRLRAGRRRGVLRRPRGIPLGLLLRRRAFHRLARDARPPRRAQAKALVPGRGAALTEPGAGRPTASSMTRDFLSTLYGSVPDSVAQGLLAEGDVCCGART